MTPTLPVGETRKLGERLGDSDSETRRDSEYEIRLNLKPLTHWHNGHDDVRGGAVRAGSTSIRLRIIVNTSGEPPLRSDSVRCH